MQLIQTVAPIKEPITLDEAKDFLRVLNADSDTLINSLIIVCREHIENATNRQLESATFELIASDFICKLPKGTLQSISSIEYKDANGDYITLSTDSYYSYERNGESFIEYLAKPLIASHKKAVKITYVCGYDSVPESIKQYMKVKISTLFENRESYVIGASIAEFGSEFVENLLSPYKIRSI